MMKLIWTQAVNSPQTVFKFQEYTFTFDKNLKPIPVEVPSDIANILLQMKELPHSCCKNKVQKPLFEQVK